MTAGAMVSAAAISTAAVVLLLKSSAVIVCVAIVARPRFARAAAARSLGWLAVFAMLAALPVATALAVWDVAGVDVPHDLLERPLSPLTGSGSLASALTTIWAIGAVWHVGRLLMDCHAASALARSAAIADGRMQSLLGLSTEQARVHQPVRIATTSALDAPAVVGWLRPIILLPTAALRWSDDEIIAVLIHELAHVRRRDWPMFLVERLLLALYWPNPLVWLAIRRAADARELAADQIVVRSGVDPATYAMRLIEVARSCTRQRLAALPLTSGRPLDERIRALFDPSPETPHPVWRLAPVVFVALVVAIVAIQPLRCIP
jgi:beta-lactamase regulating signal transducer with metallopeptidase domain